MLWEKLKGITFYALGKVERKRLLIINFFKVITEHYRSNDKKSLSFNSEVADQER